MEAQEEHKGVKSMELSETDVAHGLFEENQVCPAPFPFLLLSSAE